VINLWTPRHRGVSRIVLTACLAAAACAQPVTPTALPDPTEVPRGVNPSPTLTATRAEAQAHAEELANEWVTALKAHDFRSAWALLAAPSQIGFGSFEQFANDEREILKTAKENIVGPKLDPDPESLALWLPDALGARPKEAFIAHVEYPALSLINNGDQILVIAPDGTGVWRIWPVR
jgi:hypothetical protein